MFKVVRIAILCAILIIVIFDTLISDLTVADWAQPLYINIFPIPPKIDIPPKSSEYLKNLKKRNFQAIEKFFKWEVKRYGYEVERPVIVRLHAPAENHPPIPATKSGWATIIWWSLRMRLWSWWTTRANENVVGDVNIFVNYYPPSRTVRLERSTALRKGKIGIVNAVASLNNNAENNIIIAHELLHVLGAIDKYNFANGQPLEPDGLADLNRRPRYPQKKAEIMAVRIPLSPQHWRKPRNIGETIIGRKTAQEVGLLPPP